MYHSSCSCGNGLLTHILSAEGYSGYGIDLRARTSWAHYPDSSQAALKVHALDPTQLLSPGNNNDEKYFWEPGVFLIGNHADELTPWLPVLATLTGASGYLSIPCCAWMFDERFTRSSAASALDFSDDELLDAATGVASNETEDEAVFISSLGMGAEGTHKSQYSAYRIWLARLSRWLGWKIECDTLRIPSTRNWAIVGGCCISSSSQCSIAHGLNSVCRSRKASRRPEHLCRSSEKDCRGRCA
jgi:tRNASer (uridine44-2'-O)-methyltransferase